MLILQEILDQLSFLVCRQSRRCGSRWQRKTVFREDLRRADMRVSVRTGSDQWNLIRSCLKRLESSCVYAVASISLCSTQISHTTLAERVDSFNWPHIGCICLSFSLACVSNLWLEHVDAFTWLWVTSCQLICESCCVDRGVRWCVRRYRWLSIVSWLDSFVDSTLGVMTSTSTHVHACSSSCFSIHIIGSFMQ